jgi:hypothetical protein
MSSTTNFLADCSTQAVLNVDSLEPDLLERDWYAEREEPQVRMSSIGIQQNFANVRRRVTRQEIRKVWCNFLTDLAALTCLLYVLTVIVSFSKLS